MDWIQLHLALNHLPVIGIPLLVLLLAIGRWRRSTDVMRLALGLIAVLAAVAIGIKFTGDFAAEQAASEYLNAKDYVARHEQTADQVTTAVFLLGLTSALALFLSRRGRLLRGWVLALVLTLGLITALLYARTAHSGGQISHPELRSKTEV